MKTFQDLEKTNESLKGKFCWDAVEEFRGTSSYANAKIGEAYYNKHNVTIEAYQKP